MIVTITFKTPNVLDYAFDHLSYEEKDKAKQVADKFIAYEEYIYIQLDTNKGTAIVMPKNMKLISATINQVMKR